MPLNLDDATQQYFHCVNKPEATPGDINHKVCLLHSLTTILKPTPFAITFQDRISRELCRLQNIRAARSA